MRGTLASKQLLLPQEGNIQDMLKRNHQGVSAKSIRQCYLFTIGTQYPCQLETSTNQWHKEKCLAILTTKPKKKKEREMKKKVEENVRD